MPSHNAVCKVASTATASHGVVRLRLRAKNVGISAHLSEIRHNSSGGQDFNYRVVYRYIQRFAKLPNKIMINIMI
jgi:hypothetical protein